MQSEVSLTDSESIIDLTMDVEESWSTKSQFSDVAEQFGLLYGFKYLHDMYHHMHKPPTTYTKPEEASSNNPSIEIRFESNI